MRRRFETNLSGDPHSKKKGKCNLFTHGTPSSSQEMHSRVELEFRNVAFQGEGKTGVPREKLPGSRSKKRAGAERR